MGKYEKLLEQILLGGSDANIEFDELCQLLLRLGFETRVRGSHLSFGNSVLRKGSTCSETAERRKPIKFAKYGR